MDMNWEIIIVSLIIWAIGGIAAWAGMRGSK